MRDIFRTIKGIEILRNEPLSKHTSFHIGGNAEYFIKVYSKKALRKVLAVIKTRKLNYLIIGAGTNLLFSDRGFAGIVIQLHGVFRKIKREKNIFFCGGGVMIDAFLEVAQKTGFRRAEFLAGIPGTIGGGIRGNAGAYRRSFADITEEITVIDKKLLVKNMTHNTIGFDYRHTRIKNGTIIILAKIKLYPGKRKSILRRMNKNLKRRLPRQPLGYSAGSFFKNPKPYSAGELIESCGLKGLRVGDAVVSEKHGNWIINCRKATASDVIALAKKVKQVVRRKMGIALKEEVRILS
jgi:UDP-N-acetylmuramate dehydrogenase